MKTFCYLSNSQFLMLRCFAEGKASKHRLANAPRFEARVPLAPQREELIVGKHKIHPLFLACRTRSQDSRMSAATTSDRLSQKAAAGRSENRIEPQITPDTSMI